MRLSKINLARCRILLLLRDFISMCFTLETGKPCASHCARRQDSISSELLNSDSGTRTVALVEFIWRSLEDVMLVLHMWLIFSSSSAFSLVLASTRTDPSDRRVQVNSSFNLLCRSVHIDMPFGLGLSVSSLKLRT